MRTRRRVPIAYSPPLARALRYSAAAAANSTPAVSGKGVSRRRDPFTGSARSIRSIVPSCWRCATPTTAEPPPQEVVVAIAHDLDFV